MDRVRAIYPPTRALCLRDETLAAQIAAFQAGGEAEERVVNFAIEKETLQIKTTSATQTKQPEEPTALSLELRLYVTSTTPLSMRAMINVRRICEERLKGRYDLEVIDITQNSKLSVVEQIIAAPTLIKKLPLPPRRFIGDMSRTERILLGLDLRAKGEKHES
ncbi:circadian clock KaiB family protein [Pirellulaceae bacterium SH449]